jgi:hypothetical protein
VFFSVSPIVLSLARSMMFSSTTAVSSSFSVRRARRLGGLQQDTSSRQPPCTVFAATDQRVQLFALWVAELHDVLLYGSLFS